MFETRDKVLTTDEWTH